MHDWEHLQKSILMCSKKLLLITQVANYFCRLMYLLSSACSQTNCNKRLGIFSDIFLMVSFSKILAQNKNISESSLV
jgi:hypothetical protein